MAHVEDRWRDARTKQPTDRDGTGRRWRVRYADTEGRERSKSFDRRMDADRFRISVEADLLRGTYLDPDAGKITVRKYAEQWLGTRSMEITSRAAVAGRIAHITAGLGDRRLDQLARSPSIVSGWLAGLPVGASYAGDILGTLSSICTAAVDDGLIPRNPCRAASVKAPRVVRRKVVPWTAAQVTAVRAALPERYRAMADCGSELGLRQGEILGLPLDALDFLRRVVHVRVQVRALADGGLAFAPPKGGRERDIPLPRSASMPLAGHIRQFPPRPVTLPWRVPGGKPRTETLLFTGRHGGAIFRGDFNARAWRPARRTARMAAGRENGMHALRHRYASVLLAGGVDIVRLSEYLGHHDPAFTLRIYSHLMPDAEDRNLRAIEAALEQEADGPAADGKAANED